MFCPKSGGLEVVELGLEYGNSGFVTGHMPCHQGPEEMLLFFGH